MVSKSFRLLWMPGEKPKNQARPSPQLVHRLQGQVVEINVVPMEVATIIMRVATTVADRIGIRRFPIPRLN